MNKTCARCSKIVYPIEELKCLDKTWHKTCFKCNECSMTLNMKTYKGFNKLPYCEAHVPKAKATSIADTPELKRIAENTKLQSNVKYHADFEKQKGKVTQVADDPETLRIKQNTKIISNVAYHGDLEKKAAMEKQREVGEICDNRENESEHFSETLAAEQVSQYQHQQQSELLKSSLALTSSLSHQQKQFINEQFSNKEQNASKNQKGPAQPELKFYAQNNSKNFINLIEGQRNHDQLLQEKPLVQHNHLQQKPTDIFAQETKFFYSPNQEPVNYKEQNQQHFGIHNMSPVHLDQQKYNQYGNYDRLTFQNIHNNNNIEKDIHSNRAYSVTELDQKNEAYDSLIDNNNIQNQYYIQKQKQDQLCHVYQQQRNQTQKQSVRTYRALYDYEAQDTDEVSFCEGDIIYELESIDSGWMTGKIERTGKTGMLPANYVELF